MALATLEAIHPGIILPGEDPLFSQLPNTPPLSELEKWYVGRYVPESPTNPVAGYEALPGKVLYGAEEIHQTLIQIGSYIIDMVAPKDLRIVGLSKGADRIQDELVPIIHSADPRYSVDSLNRRIVASSYGRGTKSSGKVRIEGSPGDIQGKTVFVLDDILDTGNTIEQVRKELHKLGAAEVWTATLLTKIGALVVPRPNLGSVRITGIEIPDLFVVGHGIDWAELFRELDDIVGLDLLRRIIIPGRVIE